MTALWRALLGGILGAVLTLLLHPVSRPHLLSLWSRTTPEEISECIDSNWPTLPEPSDLGSASLWMEEAALRLKANKELRPGELETLLKVAANASESEPQNAFWPQIRAVLLFQSERQDEAVQHWTSAAGRPMWNDYQTKRLLKARENIAGRYGSQQAWQLALVYFYRSTHVADRIQNAAQQFLSKADLQKREDVLLRFHTLRNGVRLRNGSRSVDVGLRGANIIELSSYPPEMTRVTSPKRLWLAENAMINALREYGLSDEAKLAQDGFRSNDAWKAMALRENPEDLLRRLSGWSLLTATLPSLMLFIAVSGAGIWGIGFAIERLAGLKGRFRLLHTFIGAAILAGLVQLVTGFFLAAAATALCILFVTVGPSVSRKDRDEDLGPFFNFSIGVLALVFALTACAYMLGRVPQAVSLLAQVGVPPEYFGESPVFFGLSAIVFSLVFLFAPMWALVQRYTTPFVLTLSLKKFGALLALGGLILCAISGPLVVYFDRQLDEELTMIVTNEPLYYLLR